jgi:hypothetical protein
MHFGGIGGRSEIHTLHEVKLRLLLAALVFKGGHTGFGIEMNEGTKNLLVSEQSTISIGKQ